MDEPSDILRSEHEAIEHLLAVLDQMALGLKEGVSVAREDLLDALIVMTEFADRCHHAKEERVLFPALSMASPRAGAEIARRLVSDHRAFRKITAGVQELVPRAASMRTGRTHLARHLSLYTKLLREHIRIENEQLMPEVERSLSPEARQKVAAEFERVEIDEVGFGMHEAYHAIVNRLVEAYVSAHGVKAEVSSTPAL